MAIAQFVDVSEWQPQDIDWQAYKQWSEQGDGISRVALRSSYGAGYVDKHFDAYRAGALAAGIDQIIYYHYAYPQHNIALIEANWQFNVVGQFMRPQDILILDFEENVPQATGEWAYEWLVQQEANYLGKLPGLYASSAYIQQRLQDPRLARFKLWLANWQFTPDERPPVPPPWTSYEFVQYTDKATIPGISGIVDANIFLGKEETPMSQIDLTDGTVASHFSGNDTIWQCKDNGFVVGNAILNFYRSFGGDGLCGLTYLGLPKSNETTVLGPTGTTIGVVQQEFERGCVRYDPAHELDNPPGSGSVYLVHVEQDPRYESLQAQIATLTQPAQVLQQINAALAQASTSLAQVGTAIAEAAKLSQVQ